MAKQKPTSPNILNQTSPIADAAINAGISQVLSRVIHPGAGAAFSVYSGLKKLDEMGVGGSGNPSGPGGDLYTKIGGTRSTSTAPDINRAFGGKKSDPLSDVQNKKMRPKKNRVSAATGGRVSYKSVFDME